MSNLPIVFAMIGCEETVPNTVSHFIQGARNGFTEASLIAHLVQ